MREEKEKEEEGYPESLRDATSVRDFSILQAAKQREMQAFFALVKLSAQTFG